MESLILEENHAWTGRETYSCSTAAVHVESTGAGDDTAVQQTHAMKMSGCEETWPPIAQAAERFVVEEKAELDSEDMNCNFESRADTARTL